MNCRGRRGVVWYLFGDGFEQLDGWEERDFLDITRNDFHARGECCCFNILEFFD